MYHVVGGGVRSWNRGCALLSRAFRVLVPDVDVDAVESLYPLSIEGLQLLLTTMYNRTQGIYMHDR